MGSLSAEEIMRRAKCAWERKEFWREQMQDAYALVFPSRNMYLEGRTPGDQPNINIFDSTLQSSNISLANRLQAEYFPAFDEWMKVIPGVAFDAADIPVAQKEEIQIQLEQTNAVHRAAMEVSNFDQVINELLLDYGVGTGTMMVHEGDNITPLQYTAVNPAQVAMGEGPHGVVWEYYRKHPILPRLVRPTWENQGFDPPDGWDKWADAEENNKEKIIIDEAVYFSPKEKKWYLVIIGPSPSDGEQSTVKLVDRAMKNSIWLSPRWNKEAGEVWGRGPVLYALPDAKVLNKVKELILQNASVTLFPPMTYVDDSDFNPALFSMTPGFLNAVSQNSGPLGATVEKLDIGGDLGMAQFILEELRMNIKKLMLDDQLPPQTGAVHTPTEIIARQQELQVSKAAPFGRLNKELIRPLAQMNLNILAKKGLISEIKIDGLIFDLQVLNPQAQVQKENNVLKFERIAEFATNLNPALPALTMKLEEAPKWAAEQLGSPMKLMRTKADIDQMQQMAAQVQQQDGGAALGN